jgi:hypothetical protein
MGMGEWRSLKQDGLLKNLIQECRDFWRDEPRSEICP